MASIVLGNQSSFDGSTLVIILLTQKVIIFNLKPLPSDPRESGISNLKIYAYNEDFLCHFPGILPKTSLGKSHRLRSCDSF